MPTEHDELLRGVPMFAPLAPSQLERLARAPEEVHVEAGAAVFPAGDIGHTFCVVDHGRAVVESDERRLRDLGRGDFSGEIALLRDVPRTATVRAITDLRLVALDRQTFLDTVPAMPRHSLSRQESSLPA